MDCDKAQEQLGSYLGACLPPDEQDALEDHLRACVACRGELEALQRTEASLRARVPGRVPDPGPAFNRSFWQRVGRPAVAAPRRSSSAHLAARRRRSRFEPYLALAAGMVLAVGLALLVRSRSPRSGRATKRQVASRLSRADRTQPAIAPHKEPAAVAASPAVAAPLSSPDVALSPRRPATREARPRPTGPDPRPEDTQTPSAPPVPPLPGPPESRSATAGGSATPTDAGEPDTARPIARIAQILGPVRYARGPKGPWVKAVTGINLLAGDRIDTRTGMARIDFGKSRVYADRGSLIHLLGTVARPLRDVEAGTVPPKGEARGTAALLHLVKGEVYVEEVAGRESRVAGRKKRKVARPLRVGRETGLVTRSIHVSTPDALVSPVGTRFDVKRISSTLVTVIDGAVQTRARRRVESPASKDRGLEGSERKRFAWVGPTIRLTAGWQVRLRSGAVPPAPAKVSVGGVALWSDRLRGTPRVTPMVSGTLVVEAEHYSGAVGTGGSWTVERNIKGFLGEGYVRSRNARSWLKPDVAAEQATLEYRIFLPEPGEFTFAIRGWAGDLDSESAYVSLDGGAPIRIAIHKYKQWAWSQPVKLRVHRRGLKILRLMQREIDFRCDRLMLTRRTERRFRGKGPPETPAARVPVR